MSHDFDTGRIEDGGQRSEPAAALGQLDQDFNAILEKYKVMQTSSAVVEKFAMIVGGLAETTFEWSVKDGGQNTTGRFQFENVHDKFYAYAGLVVYAFERMQDFIKGNSTPAIEAFVRELYGVLSNHGIQPANSGNPFSPGNPIYLAKFNEYGFRTVICRDETKQGTGITTTYAGSAWRSFARVGGVFSFSRTSGAKAKPTAASKATVSGPDMPAENRVMEVEVEKIDFIAARVRRASADAIRQAYLQRLNISQRPKV